MPAHLLRKVLLLVPAAWLAGTLVFLLSRLIPGSYGENQILNVEASFYSKSSQQSREQAFREYQQKNGLDKPLFYFSLSPTAVPDTLHRVYPEPRRKQLEQLALSVGSWPEVAAYDLQVQRIQSLPLPLSKQEQQAISTLRYSSSFPALEQAAELLQNKPVTPEVAQRLAALNQALEALVDSRQILASLLPRLSWHGIQNQYHSWLVAALSGDFGNSYRTGRPALTEVRQGIGNTLLLLLVSMLVVLAMALELSILMVRRKLLWLRRALLPSLFILDSVPALVLAFLLLVLLANPAFLQLFPVYGMGYYTSGSLSAWQQLSLKLQYMALPMLTLVLVNLPYLTSQVHTSLQAALQASYSRTAKAKGLSEGQVIRRHALRNALLPIITIVSDFLPALVSGSILIETVFAIPGIGRLLVESVLARDTPVLVLIVLVVLVVRALSYFSADILYTKADPRLKHSIL
ncbi:ABC transporter permease [Pontibacter mangrovi]|uniref:ABC transporter permease n=1 Tax=Pontibacter mangrovi TaxID=2589816 RepID=A0A501W5D8_9BACT|nr:ABC transporter permease [Pontibacter mangrovi]TPE43304.1 ABC transporter permease [Pontibacter mangrovi]